MPHRVLRTNIGGKETELRVEWTTFWRKTSVYVDQTLLGAVESNAELKKGKEWALPSGDKVGVELRKSFLGVELQITLNGQPVVGSSSHPISRIKTGAAVVFFLSGLNMLAGLIAVIAKPPALLSIGVGAYNLFLAPLYLIAGLMMRRHSIVGVSLAIALFLGDTVMALITAVQVGIRTGVTPPPTWIIVRIFLFVPIFRAAQALIKIRGQSTNAT